MEKDSGQEMKVMRNRFFEQVSSWSETVASGKLWDLILGSSDDDWGTSFRAMVSATIARWQGRYSDQYRSIDYKRKETKVCYDHLTFEGGYEWFQTKKKYPADWFDRGKNRARKYEKYRNVSWPIMQEKILHRYMSGQKFRSYSVHITHTPLQKPNGRVLYWHL